MSETTKRDPRTEPIHPNPQVRANNPQAAARALRDKHAATVAAIRDALGAKASTDGADLLAGMASLLAIDGTANDHFGYLLESNVVAARMRRQQAAAAAAAAKAAA